MTRRKLLYAAALAGKPLLCMAQGGNQPKQVSEALSKFGPQARQIIAATLGDRSFRGRIPVTTVNNLLRLEKKPMEALMLSFLPLAKTFSRPPLSNYFVGAVIRGSSGSFYLGANIEIPGRSLGLTVHAEQAALANAYLSGEAGVSTIAIGEAPCGYCRQFLNELSPDHDIQVLISGVPSTKLSALLPQAFGPKDMGLKQGALPVKRNSLSLVSGSKDLLVLAALDAAQKSYSPYTFSPSGIAIAVRGSVSFPGAYIENAAFNPSLPPLESALAGLFAAGKEGREITRAVLVESTGSKISQEGATREALSSLAPNVALELAKARV